MAEVVLDSLSRVFARGVVAVDSASLSVDRGELLVLLGPSGSGKSTLLRLIAGLDEATSGEVLLSGRRANGLHPSQRDVAMVLQQPVLYSHMSVRENLAFGLRMQLGRGWILQRLGRWLRRSGSKGDKGGSVEIDRQVEWAAKLLRIGHLLDRMPNELAGGEQRRVALGRALARRPALFLLDEPLSSLDAPLRYELREEIRSFQQGLGSTMIYVTHDQAEAFAIADRVAVIRKGRIEQVGTPEEIYDAPATQSVAQFVGFPAGNFLQGEWIERSGAKVFRPHSGLDELPLEGGIPQGWRSGLVVCGVRPEDVSIDAGGGLKALVQRVTMSDGEQLVRLQAVGENRSTNSQRFFTSKVSRRLALSPGDQVRIGLVGSRCHWFDPETGLRIGD